MDAYFEYVSNIGFGHAHRRVPPLALLASLVHRYSFTSTNVQLLRPGAEVGVHAGEVGAHAGELGVHAKDRESATYADVC